MSMLYDKNLMGSLAANGSEQLQKVNNPDWFGGTASEIWRGLKNIPTAYERTARQTDSTAANALGVNQYLTRDGKVAQIRDITPTPKADLPKFEKPDYQNSGKASIMLGDFVQQAPALAAAMVNPLLGFAQAAAQGSATADQEADERGLTGDARRSFIGLSAVEDGIGGSFPGWGGIGDRAVIKYGSRFLAGGLFNTGLTEAGTYSRAEVLDAYGYHGQAVQMRQWDGQAFAANFIMGGAFNLAGGVARERERPNTSPSATETSPLNATQEAIPSPGASADSVTPAQPTPDTGARLSRVEVKQAKSDVANSQRHLERIDAEEAAIRDAAPTSSGGANRRYFEQNRAQLDDLQAQREMSQRINDEANQRLQSHYDYNRERLSTDTKDAATNAVLHDNYVTESAPGLATDAHGESAHVRAMDSAMDSVHNGRPVDVSEHMNGDSEFLHPAGQSLDAGGQERQTLAGDMQTRADAITRSADQQVVPEGTGAPTQPGIASPDGVTPFDTLRANAEGLRETFPELADTILPHIDTIEAEHRSAYNESSIYDVAAACAISFGS